jgi:hypothetical protein
MAKNILPIVKDLLPDFIRTDHPMFQTFFEAYYEFLEVTNDSDSLSVKDRYKRNPNAGTLIAEAEKHIDVYTTLDDFVVHFQRQLIPIDITGNSVTDAFMLNKARDIYLAKGTPKSYELLFALLYGEKIDVFEPKDQIIQASEGLYVNFAQIKVSIVNNPTRLEDFQYELATIRLDSDNNDSEGSQTLIVVDGTYEGVIKRTSFTGAENEFQPVLTLILSQLPDSDTIVNKLARGTQYILRDPLDDTKNVGIKILSHVSSMEVTGKSSGMRVGDLISVTDEKESINVSVDQISTGAIERIFVRNRGLNYRVNDTIEFINQDSRLGAGAIAVITAVDLQGAITQIDGVNVRTGANNNGYLSDDFVDTSIPINQGGAYTSVPKAFIRTNTGSGADVAGWSQTVGAIQNLSITNSGFFDSDELGVPQIFSPLSFDISQNEDLPIGSIVEFQYFEPDTVTQSFANDSELVKIKFFYDSDYAFGNGGSRTSIGNIQLPVKWDSENFQFQFKTFSDSDIGDLDTESRNPIIIQRYLADSDFVSNLGSGATVTVDSDSDLTGLKKHYVFTLTIDQPRLYRLDDFHFRQLSIKAFNDSDLSVAYSTEINISAKEADSENAGNYSIGKFVGTGYGGVITSKSADARSYTVNRIKNVKSNGSAGDSDLIFPTISDIAEFDNRDYAILRISRISPENGQVLTPETFPISNVVTRYSSPELKTTFNTVSLTNKRYLDESGFLSSVSGGVIRDNYTISEFSYIIQSGIPIKDWKGKVKTTLHPAGLQLFGELNVNSNQNITLSTDVIQGKVDIEDLSFTFDADDDFYDDASRLGQAVLSDSVAFESNPYNLISLTNDATGTLLTADYTRQASSSVEIGQHGNAWFDYEPVGLIHSEWTVFDSEGHFNNIVNNFDSDSEYDIYSNYFYRNFKDNQANGNGWALRSGIDSDFFIRSISTQSYDSDVQYISTNVKTYYKPSHYPSSRYSNRDTVGVVQTQFEDMNYIRAYDSDLSLDVYTRWDAVSTPFKKVDYTKIKDSDSDNLTFNSAKDRKSELQQKKAKELNQALYLDNRFSFVNGKETLYNVEAYEAKYNTFNKNRDSDISSGWQIVGDYASMMNISSDYSDSETDSDKFVPESRIRNKFRLDEQRRVTRFATRKAPHSKKAFGIYGDSENSTSMPVVQPFYLTGINTTVQILDSDSVVRYPLDKKRK